MEKGAKRCYWRDGTALQLDCGDGCITNYIYLKKKKSLDFLNGCILWYGNYPSIKLLKQEKDEGRRALL